MMVPIPTKEVLDFIFQQPDDRPVSMLEPYIGPGNTCGCVLVHMMKERHPGCQPSAGYRNTRALLDNNEEVQYWLEHSIGRILPIIRWKDVQTYADVKRHLNPNLLKELSYVRA